MRILVFSILVLLAFTGFAQKFSSEVFHKGYIVTTAKDTIKGSVKYDMEANTLSVLAGGKLKSFSSNNIFYFEIFDEILNNYRQFYSLPYNVSYGYKIPVLFELIFEGELSLMLREAIVQKQVNSGNYWGAGVLQTVIEHSYYFVDKDGDIKYFSGKKRDIYAIMNKKQNDIKKYIKDNRLDTGDIRDLIRLTSFYNSVIKSDV